VATDYWLSKLMFDLQDPKVLAEFRADRAALIARYNLDPEARRGLMTNDVAILAPRVNAYLLRYYFQFAGVPDSDFIAGLRALRPAEARHG
jgi:Aromatic-ring-opening dioxygenase LigAB, LigA subunit